MVFPSLLITLRLVPTYISGFRHTLLRPAFPSESIRAGHSGIAVADVRVSGSGSVLEVHPLQAPDEAIRQELVNSLSKWLFTPTTAVRDGQPVEVEGRLMFFFSLRGGKPTVVDLTTEHAADSPKKTL